MNKIKLAIWGAVLIAALLTIVLVISNGQSKKEAELQHEKELRMAAYPKLDDLLAVKDEITELTTQEGDIVYKVTDKEAIAKVLNILESVELTPVDINPEDDKGRPTGGVADALELTVHLKDENEYWSLTVDYDALPTDFVIEHGKKSTETLNYSAFETGYYTKPDKIYGNIKAILYNGERIDLNEVPVPKDNPEIDFDYDPDVEFKGEEVDFVKESGYETLDVNIGADRIFFCCNKEKENSDIEYVDYEGVLYDYVWGYTDKDGANRRVFEYKSDDEEYPYAGIQGIIGATESRIYAFVFDARMNDSDDSGDKAEIRHYLASFDYEGKLVGKVAYDYSFYKGLSVRAVLTGKSTIAVLDLDGITLFDADLSELCKMKDNGISNIMSGQDGNVVALLWHADYMKHEVYDGKTLEKVTEYPLEYYKFNQYPMGLTKDYKILALRTQDETKRSKIITIDPETYGAEEVMFFSYYDIIDYGMPDGCSVEDDGTILCEEIMNYDRHYVSLIRYTKESADK